MMTINLNELLAVIGSALLVCLIIFFIRLIGILGEVKELIVENKKAINNTFANVDSISTNTKDVYGAITGKVSGMINKKKENLTENEIV